MLYETIGSTGTRIPRIGIGGMGVGGYFSTDSSRDEDWIQVLRLAFEQGMSLVDTAESYGSGHSEELIGRATAGRRREVYLATKVSPEHLDAPSMVASAEGSLRRLSTDCIDLYQVHWPNPSVPLDETMEALGGLVRAGKIRHVGLCNFTLRQLREAEGLLGPERISAVQVEYNMFDRTIEGDYLPYCQQRGIRVLAYSPLDQGNICGGPVTRARVQTVAQRAGCTLGQLALAWVVSHRGVIAIPKASSREHVVSNGSAADVKLTRPDIELLDRITSAAARSVPVERISVVPDDTGQRKVYRTVEEARENAYGFSPSPSELAQAMLDGDFLKPVRVRPAADRSEGFDYELLEGRIRYWAWVIAFSGRRDIPVLVRE